MKYTFSNAVRGCAVLMVMGLAGCYYPVYTPYPPPYTGYPYGYAPAPHAVAPAPPPLQQDCREYRQPSMIDGKMQTLYGTACRQPDGSWRDSMNGSPVNMESIPSNPMSPPPPQSAMPPYPAPPTPPTR